MQVKKFYVWLTALTLGCLAIAYGLQHIPGFEDSFALSLFTIAFFVLLCILIQVLAKRAATHPNPNLLTQLIMVLVFVKLALCLLIVMIYDRLYNPSSRHFVLPFLFIYVVYTAFEVYLLTKANRLTAQPRGGGGG